MTEPVKHEWELQPYGMIDVSGLDPLQFFVCKHCGEGKCGERVPNPQSVAGCYKVWNRRETCYTKSELAEREIASRDASAQRTAKRHASEEKIRSSILYQTLRQALSIVKLHKELTRHAPEERAAFELAERDIGICVREYGDDD